ncbi:MAG: hypothetical protein Q8Q29_07420, partial [Actinomycetota bacterium]|nr:hypothetical protein [Actinomycetota bacterium]
MSSALRTIFAMPALRRLAGPRSFERGLEYSSDRRLKNLRVTDDEASAIVRGTSDYKVRLWIKNGGPGFECTCPMGDGGEFCKHCVAVGLALVEEETRPSSARAATTADLRSYLQTQDRETLIDLLLDRASEDEFLRGRLELEAAKSVGRDVNLDAYRQAIDEVIVVRDGVDYREAYDYSQSIGEVINSIRELLDAGHAEEVIALSEHALADLEDAWGLVDDSDGWIGGERDELVELHHEASLVARPDPAALAERLFQWELHSDWETFDGAAEHYADVLGPEGLATYRSLAEKAWARVPARSPGDGHDSSTFRSRITHIMETLARVSGDVDAVVAVKSRDLSSAYVYIQIAEVLREAGRHDDGLEWAERGLAAFPRGTDWRLRELVADEYHRRDRHDEAMALVWAIFSDRPGLATYERLHHHAKLADAGDEWRDKALGLLHAQATAAKADEAPRSRWVKQADHSTLVEVFLWENDLEAAWTEAQAGGCSDRLWMRLAVAREQDHPADALPIYQAHVEQTIQVKKNDAYAAAVEWMVKVRELLDRMGRVDEFPAYAAEVR